MSQLLGQQELLATKSTLTRLFGFFLFALLQHAISTSIL